MTGIQHTKQIDRCLQLMTSNDDDVRRKGSPGSSPYRRRARKDRRQTAPVQRPDSPSVNGRPTRPTTLPPPAPGNDHSDPESINRQYGRSCSDSVGPGLPGGRPSPVPAVSGRSNQITPPDVVDSPSSNVPDRRWSEEPSSSLLLPPVDVERLSSVGCIDESPVTDGVDWVSTSSSSPTTLSRSGSGAISRRSRFQTTLRRKDSSTSGSRNSTGASISPRVAGNEQGDLTGGLLSAQCVVVSRGGRPSTTSSRLQDSDDDSSTGSDDQMLPVTPVRSNDGDSNDDCDRSQEPTEVKDPLLNIIEELVMTEQRYVFRLKILVEVKEKTSEIISPDVAKNMFQNIDIIYKFHHDSLYPKLSRRLTYWVEKKKIGDVMSSCAPFLKLYTDYVTNLKAATILVDSWKEKSRKFAQMISDLKDSTSTERLTLQAYMLEPIQRVPRYELLLREYLKKLPQDSDDRPETQKAMEIVSDAASHFETMLKRDAHMSELIQIQRQLIATKINLVHHERCLLRRANVTVVHRSGRRADRVAFLFNDLLLLCVERPVVMKYQVKNEFWFTQSQVRRGNNLAIPNTLIISCHKQAVELAFSVEEYRQWERELQKRIRELTKKKMLKLSTKEASADTEPEVKTTRYAAYSLGDRAPVMMPKEAVHQCPQCEQDLLTDDQKHNCRACGKVFCTRCTSHMAMLTYCRDSIVKVCDECFLQLQPDTPDPAEGRPLSGLHSRQGSVTKNNLMEQGYLQISGDGGVTWAPRWFCLFDSGYLSTYRTDQDSVPLASVNLTGFSVDLLDIVNLQPRALLLVGNSKSYLLHDDDENVVHRWFDMLSLVIYPSTKETLV